MISYCSPLNDLMRSRSDRRGRIQFVSVVPNGSQTGSEELFICLYPENGSWSPYNNNIALIYIVHTVTIFVPILPICMYFRLRRKWFTENCQPVFYALWLIKNKKRSSLFKVGSNSTINLSWNGYRPTVNAFIQNLILHNSLLTCTRTHAHIHMLIKRKYI